MQIHEAPHGINVVVETPETVYIGRFDSTNGFQALLHDCAVHAVEPGQDPEEFVRTTAKYGVPVSERDVMVDVGTITRVRVLGDISQD